MPFDRRDSDRRSRDRRTSNRRRGPEWASSEDEPKSLEEITQLRSHLEYEMRMLKDTIEYLTLHGDRVGESDMNAYLESFLLHATTLINFYFPPGYGVTDDVIASDFIPHWQEHVTLSELLMIIRSSADRGLGRLSYRTLELPLKKQLAAIYDEFESLRSRFELLLKTLEESESETIS